MQIKKGVIDESGGPKSSAGHGTRIKTNVETKSRASTQKACDTKVAKTAGKAGNFVMNKVFNGILNLFK